MQFFNPNSKFFQVMTSFGEMMILNICWIIGSLPIITIGSSNTAMYTVMGRRLRDEGSGTVGPFFKAWWSNLKTSTLFWVPQVFVTGSLGMFFFMRFPLFLKIVAGVLLVITSMTFGTIYPQIARFRNRPFAYLRNAVILDVLKLGRVVLNLLLWLSPLGFFLLMPFEFLQLGLIWIFFGFSLLFYLSAQIMQNILTPLEEVANNR